jgi:hypothetical protein
MRGGNDLLMDRLCGLYSSAAMWSFPMSDSEWMEFFIRQVEESKEIGKMIKCKVSGRFMGTGL